MTAVVVPRFRCGDDYRKSESPLGKPEGSISIGMFVVLGQQHEHTTTAGNPQVERADFGPCRFDDREPLQMSDDFCSHGRDRPLGFHHRIGRAGFRNEKHKAQWKSTLEDAE